MELHGWRNLQGIGTVGGKWNNGENVSGKITEGLWAEQDFPCGNAPPASKVSEIIVLKIVIFIGLFNKWRYDKIKLSEKTKE